MRVLVVDAYKSEDPESMVVDHAAETLRSLGNDVRILSLDCADFAGYMTAEEHRAYETDDPLVAPATKTSAASVQWAEALLFCYPTTLFGVPPLLKGWLERVMVLGVAFVFDDKQRIKPGLKNVRRLGVITTSPHGRLATGRARDLGRRTILRTLRLNCHPLCRRTFVRLSRGAPAGRVVDQLSRSLRNWTPPRPA